MLSTTQALKEWEGVIKLLAEIKAARPYQNSMPANLAQRFTQSLHVPSKGLASPAPTWRQLLQKKVSTHDMACDKPPPNPLEPNQEPQYTPCRTDMVLQKLAVDEPHVYWDWDVLHLMSLVQHDAG
jgi:hypothetical protein